MLRYALAAAFVLSGCVVEDGNDDSEATTSQPAVTQQPAPPPPPDLRLEVNLAERRLYVYKADKVVGTHPVAVGSK